MCKRHSHIFDSACICNFSIACVYYPILHVYMERVYIDVHGCTTTSEICITTKRLVNYSCCWLQCLNVYNYVHMIFIHFKATSNPIWESKQQQNEKKNIHTKYSTEQQHHLIIRTHTYVQKKKILLLVMKRKIYHLTNGTPDRICVLFERTSTKNVAKKGKNVYRLTNE